MRNDQIKVILIGMLRDPRCHCRRASRVAHRSIRDRNGRTVDDAIFIGLLAGVVVGARLAL